MIKVKDSWSQGSRKRLVDARDGVYRTSTVAEDVFIVVKRGDKDYIVLSDGGSMWVAKTPDCHYIIEEVDLEITVKSKGAS